MFTSISAKLEDGPRPMTDAELIADAARKELFYMDLKQVIAELTSNIVIIAAGSVTSALMITFMVAQLCRNGEQYKTLQEEIDSCWDGKSPIDLHNFGEDSRQSNRVQS